MSVVVRMFTSAMIAMLPACASVGPREPVRFAEATRPAGSESLPNWAVPPDRAIWIMAQAEFEIERVAPTAAGTSGAEKVDARLSGTDVRIKTKEVPRDLDGINNAPRKELAAYALQPLFLDPEDYVVPATTLRCVPVARRQKWHDEEVVPTIPGTSCALLVVAMWLRDVTVPEVVLDRARFLTEPGYAYYLANLNVFTYLIEHRDGRKGNLLISKDDRRQVFAIDNGVAFGQRWPFYNWFVSNWDVLRVPAVRKETIDRLRALEREDLDFLLVVAQLEPDDQGVLQLVPPGPPIDADRGASRRGTTVQFGLTEDEIDDVWKRIRDLIEQVDGGDLPIF
ncbi:MAG: hypothetical protein JRH19_27605 [Deltaproteobacteria bacterium]|nr:hypothetical protein [Deltaproteobacteria bacterium]